MTGKTEACYDVAFFMLNNDLGGLFNPFIIGIDFERAFINMTRKHWPEATLIGCFFHFKQALRRYLISELRFPKEIVSMMMRRGFLDLATVLPMEDVCTINGKGWLYIAALIDCTSSGNEEADRWFHSFEGRTKLAMFYLYIKKFWLSDGIFQLWNWAAFINCPREAIKFRTNCWMESYNKEWGEKFAVAHPSLAVFLNTVIAEQDRVYDNVNNLRNDRADPIKYGEIDYPQIPDDYSEFEMPSLKKINLTTRPNKRRS